MSLKPQHRKTTDKADSRRRVIRTAYAATVAFLTALPVITGYVPLDLIDAPQEAKLAAFAAWVVTVNKAIATLEDFGVIPPWLRDTHTNSKEN